MRKMGCTPRARWARRYDLTRILTVVGSILVALIASTATSASSGAVASAARQYGGGRLLAADPSGGYWTTTPTGDVEPHAGALRLGSPGISGDRLNQPIVGMEATPDGEVTGSSRPTGHLQLRRRQLLRIDRVHPTQPAHRGHGVHARRRGLLARRFRRWNLLLRRRRLLRLDRVASDSTSPSWAWRPRPTAGAIGSSPPTVASSPTATPASTARPGRSNSTSPSWAWRPRPTDEGYWLVASDGGIFTFGDAPYYGSLGGTGSSVLGLVVAPSSGGYALVTANGGEQTFVPSPSPLAEGTGALSPTLPTSTTTTTLPPTTTTTQPPSEGTGMTTGYYEADIEGGPGSDDCAPSTIPTVTPDASLDSLFDDQAGPGWLGGDATYSTALPNGQESFVFGDTLLGTAAPDGQITTFNGMVHDSELVGHHA